MYKLGVVIGKFQSPEPTEAHIGLITTAKSNCDHLLILVGENPASKNHEIDLIPYDVRVELIYNALYNHYIKYTTLMDTIAILKEFTFKKNMDVFNPPLWSNNVDNHIIDTFAKLYGTEADVDSVCLFGGRDSFLKTYSGKFTIQKTVALVCGDSVSATAARLVCKEKFIADPMFIRGAFHHAMNQYAISFQTVDVLIRHHIGDQTYIVLGRKKNEDKYVFIGGFSEPTSPSLEHDAVKEVFEEVSYEVKGLDTLKYVGSMLVDDPRYRNSMHKIKTAMFVLDVYDTKAEFIPADDIVEVEIFAMNDLTSKELMNKHVPLYNFYVEKGLI